MQIQTQTQTSNLFLVKTPCRTARKQASLAALCDFQLFPVKTYLFTNPLQQQVNQVLQPLKKLILAFCLTVGLADVPLKVTAKLLPGGPFLYLTSPVGFPLPYSLTCLESTPRHSTDRCVNQSAYCSNYVFIYSQRRFRNVYVTCLYLYPLQSVCYGFTVRVSLCPPLSGVFN